MRCKNGSGFFLYKNKAFNRITHALKPYDLDIKILVQNDFQPTLQVRNVTE